MGASANCCLQRGWVTSRSILCIHAPRCNGAWSERCVWTQATPTQQPYQYWRICSKLGLLMAALRADLLLLLLPLWPTTSLPPARADGCSTLATSRIGSLAEADREESPALGGTVLEVTAAAVAGRTICKAEPALAVAPAVDPTPAPDPAPAPAEAGGTCCWARDLRYSAVGRMGLRGLLRSSTRAVSMRCPYSTTSGEYKK